MEQTVDLLRMLYAVYPRLYQDIFVLFLTLLDCKPCGILDILCGCERNKISLRNPECVLWRRMSALLFDILQFHELTYHIVWNIHEGYDTHTLWVFYGHKQEEVEKLYCFQQKPYNHTGMGLLLGYPQTAVEAFNKDTYHFSSLPEEIDSILGADRDFLYFALSKKYWREEIQEVRENISLVKGIAPWLFE